MVLTMPIPARAPHFLDEAGWPNADIVPVAGDASFRRYFRVIQGQESAILMDAPPPHEDPRPFIAIARYLAAHDFHAPGVIAQDLDHGLVLIEDFGDVRMREHLEAYPERELAIYSDCIDLLRRLHRTECAALRAYDWAEYRREALLLTEWYCPANGLAVDTAGYERAWEQALAPVLAAQHDAVTVLRDYHAENIMLLAGGKLGLLDFQDALAGHRAYDLVSLLQDARRDVSPEIEAAMLSRFLTDWPADAADAFRADYAVLGAQRSAKIIGIFTRLWRRDGKDRYLDFLPRMWVYLERDLQHPALATVAEWFADNIPLSVRRASPGGAGAS